MLLDDKWKSRKFANRMKLNILGVAWGVFCAVKGVSLVDAALFWGTIEGGSVFYNRENVKEKQNGS